MLYVNRSVQTVDGGYLHRSVCSNRLRLVIGASAKRTRVVSVENFFMREVTQRPWVGRRFRRVSWLAAISFGLEHADDLFTDSGAALASGESRIVLAP